MRLSDKCGIPDCRNEKEENSPICQSCRDNGYLTDYYAYRDMIDDGVSRQQAAVLAGLTDPND